MSATDWILGLAAWRLGVAATWLAAAWLLAGWGLLLQRSCFASQERQNANALLGSCWLGLCLVVAFLQIWHLFAPVGSASLAVLAAVAALGWSAVKFGPLAQLCHGLRQHPRLAFCSALGVLFLSHQACGNPYGLQDFGAYHLQTIRWYQAYAIVPGLGNLHDRLAFNNSSFLLDAQVLLGPWHSTGFGIVNGLLLCGVAAQSGLSLWRLLSRASSALLTDALGALFLIPLLHYQPLPIQTTSTDITVALLFFAALPYLARVLASPAEDAGAEFWKALLLSVGLLAVAVSTKISAAPAALLLLAPALWRVARERTRGSERWKHLGVALALAAILGITWGARGVALNGYLMYPSLFIKFDVPWRVSESVGRWQQLTIAESAKRPTVIPIEGPWFAEWCLRHGSELVLPLLWDAAAAVTCGWCWKSQNVTALERQATTLIVLGCLGAAMIAFLLAPDPRFYSAYLYGAGAVMLALSLRTLDWTARFVVPRGFLPLMGFGIALVPLYYAVFALFPTLQAFSYLHRDAVLLLKTPPAGKTDYVLPQPQLAKMTTDSGLEVHVPVGMKNTSLLNVWTGERFVTGRFRDPRAWDAPLPSTPHLDRRLRLRAPGDLGSGFLISPPAP